MIFSDRWWLSNEDDDYQVIDMTVVFQTVQFLGMTLQKIHCGSAHSVSAGKVCCNLNQNRNESLL